MHTALPQAALLPRRGTYITLQHAPALCSAADCSPMRGGTAVGAVGSRGLDCGGGGTCASASSSGLPPELSFGPLTAMYFPATSCASASPLSGPLDEAYNCAIACASVPLQPKHFDSLGVDTLDERGEATLDDPLEE